MKLVKLSLGLAAAALLSACATDVPIGADKSVDRNSVDRKDLSQIKWGVWVDPDGCDNWIADDGVEGYLARRLDKYGKPVCSGVAPPTVATGDFKGGSTSVIGDPL
ncbi:hypothetical protein ACFSDD_16195 [Salipiger marinus]|jgi:hypothetical protein|uniref:Lipoprotein n=1 Tax=Salipiger marinus TaxID=555512 RepID=A0A1G8LHT8_9RHOB|nr:MULTISPECIES: hypothetical protein [Salipiger]HBM59404.1 hypothetical protein [Citreicella sp.]MCD1619859.1 hypothetical protein [Salipiger manganoxidans]MEB3418471.1 hypothetical protein [Salipiger manganoxidans]SDI55185.1 hypothetical protein SAMN04487993_1006169 [Salipiger marinus]HBS99557.1 hypothetical protein [Citreicella sp.]